MLRLVLAAFLLFVVTTDASPAFLRDLGLKSRLRRTRDCAPELSDASSQFLNYILQHEFPSQIGPYRARELVRRITGHDLVQDQVMDSVACRISEVSSFSDLKATLDDLGTTFSVVRVAYDYMTAAYPQGRQFLEMLMEEYEPHEPNPLIVAALGLMDIAEEAGLLNLDPAGTQWFSEIMFGGRHGPPHKRRFHKRQSSSTCDRAHALLNEILELAVFNPQHPNPNPDMIANIVFLWTGIDINNEELRRTLMCEILEIDNLEGRITEFLDSHRILNYVIAAGMPLLSDQMADLKDRNERILAEWEEAENQGVDVPYLEEQAAMARVFLPFYRELDEAGLWSLRH